MNEVEKYLKLDSLANQIALYTKLMSSAVYAKDDEHRERLKLLCGKELDRITLEIEITLLQS